MLPSPTPLDIFEPRPVFGSHWELVLLWALGICSLCFLVYLVAVFSRQRRRSIDAQNMRDEISRLSFESEDSKELARLLLYRLVGSEGEFTSEIPTRYIEELRELLRMLERTRYGLEEDRKAAIGQLKARWALWKEDFLSHSQAEAEDD